MKLIYTNKTVEKQKWTHTFADLEDLEKVFPSPVEIEILKIEEVSNHYE